MERVPDMLQHLIIQMTVCLTNCTMLNVLSKLHKLSHSSLQHSGRSESTNSAKTKLPDKPLHYVIGLFKCFRAGYFTFSQLKFKVNKGINL